MLLLRGISQYYENNIFFSLIPLGVPGLVYVMFKHADKIAGSKKDSYAPGGVWTRCNCASIAQKTLFNNLLSCKILCKYWTRLLICWANSVII